MCHTNVVFTGQGKHTFGEKLSTSELTGCVATLLYFENKDKHEGIVTHYLPLLEGNKVQSFLSEPLGNEVDKNIRKLDELKQERIRDIFPYQSGVMFFSKKDEAVSLLEQEVKRLFPETHLRMVEYSSSKKMVVSMNPLRKEWESTQHGLNEF